MNNNQFSAVVEVDNIFSELQKDICRVFNKYGVKDELINEVLKNTQRLEMFVSSEQNKFPMILSTLLTAVLTLGG